MGLGMRGEVWKPQLDGLQDHCQLLHFDNRGVGESDNIGEFLSMQDMARDAARVLDAAGWTEDVHLVGVSMGGMISQELALFSQERFASLTLVATHPGGPTSWLPPALGIARFLAVQFGPPEKRTEAMAKLLYPKSFLDSCDREQLHQRMTFQMGSRPKRHTMKKQLAAIRRHDTRQRLGQIYLPTLIIKPELDILVNPEHSERLKRGIRHASMMVLPDAGHGLIFQSAQEVNERLLEHFASAAGAAQQATR